MKRIKVITSALALTAGLIAPLSSFASSITLHLFSEVNGQVLMNGVPLVGAEVQRLYTWKTDKYVNKTVTDAEGRYHFPLVSTKSLFWSWVPHEPYISQRVNIIHEGKTFNGWFYSKHDYDLNGELKGKPIKLLCDLKDPEAPHFDSEHYGFCFVDFSQD